MNAPLPPELKLEQLSVAERLVLFEAVWASLENQGDETLHSPYWHNAEVERRIQMLDKGSSVDASWEEVRAGIVRRSPSQS